MILEAVNIDGDVRFVSFLGENDKLRFGTGKFKLHRLNPLSEDRAGVQ